MEAIKRLIAVVVFFGVIFGFYSCKNQVMIRSPRYFDRTNPYQPEITKDLPDSVAHYVGMSVNGEYLILKVHGKEIAISVDLVSIEDKYNQQQDTVIKVNVYEPTGNSYNFKEWIEFKNKQQ